MRNYYKILYCLLFNISFLCVEAQEINSSYGKVLSPKGDLRILIIYAGFEGFDESQETSDWPPNSDFPSWKSENLFYNSMDQFEKYAQDTTIVNISKFYNEMSKPLGNFRMVADIFPKRININLDNANNFGTCNRLVIEKIQKEYPNFDWSKYDQRTNFPNYKFDNSVSLPDKKPDYIIVAYRYVREWGRQPKEGMNLWTPTYSALDGLYGINFNGYTFDGAGFTMGTFGAVRGGFIDLFLHEMAHELYSCPHYSGTNGAMGKYLYTPSCGSDMMSIWRGQVASAFERWLLGWIDIKHDLDNWRHNGIYELRDFVTTGDAIRIKIPHVNQYLWIENRQCISIYDHNNWRSQLMNNPLGSKGIADRDKGLNIYIEEVLNDRKKIDAGLVYDLDKVNGIMHLHARGNYDYLYPRKLTHTDHTIPGNQQVYWNNFTYWFEQTKPNPIAGLNPFINYRNDMDKNKVINTVIGLNGEYNGMADTESFPILMEKVKDTFMLTYAHIGGRNADVSSRHPDTFVSNDEIGLDYNPMLINRPKFVREKDSLAPYFLNGLYIKVISQKKGVIKLQVTFDRTTISKDARWCGNIISKSVPHAKHDYAIDIKAKTSIVLDRSGTVNNSKNAESDFIAPTVMVIDSGSTMHIGRNATFRIFNGSKLVVNEGGKIILGKGAKLEADKNSFLEIFSPASLVER